jgi:hypothetical protein
MTKTERDLRIRIFEELVVELPRSARPDAARCIDDEPAPNPPALDLTARWRGRTVCTLYRVTHEPWRDQFSFETALLKLSLRQAFGTGAISTGHLICH